MRMLSTEEAALLLHLNPKQVQRLARAGRLPASRVGRRWLFDETRLLAALGSAAPRGLPPIEVSARNRLAGTVERIVVDGLMAEVVLRIGDQELVALITRSSAERLGLGPGVQAFAVIKSTEVMIGRQGEP